MSAIPEPIAADFARGKRLEWWTLGWMGSVIGVMWLAMGGSQAMQTALIEDMLSLIPAVTWLIAARFEPRPATRHYPFGFVRVNSLAFLVSAVALTLVGAFTLYEGVHALIAQEHPTIDPVRVFGHDVWLGWLMIAALIYSMIPPMILGHKKHPVAQRLKDKVLHTDALMQKADWQTGGAGILGIAGIAWGLWWADSAAAIFIAGSILKDGIDNVRTSAAELLDGVPRALDSHAVAADAVRLEERLADRWPHATIRIRESGRYLFATVEGVDEPGEIPSAADLMGADQAWRLGRLDFARAAKVPSA